MNVTLELSEAQFKGLAHIAVDPIDWIHNVVSGRAAAAMDEIYAEEVKRALADPAITAITADKEAVVLSSMLPSAAIRARQALDDVANIPAPRIIPTADFRAKFADAQLAELWARSAGNPALSVFLMKAFTAQTVDLDSSDVKDGLGYLISLGFALDPAKF